MQRLILLNFIGALLFMATMVAFQGFESGSLLIAGMGSMLVLAGLALWNFCSIFLLWGKYGFRAVYPALGFVLAVGLSLQGGRCATRIMLAGTPCFPDSFLKGQTKLDLEKAATELLGHSFKAVSANPSTAAQMIRGHQKAVVPADVTDVLQKYGFREAEVDDSQSLVTFSYYHMRAWYHYTYTTDNFVPLGCRPPVITESDIEDWSELIRIAKQDGHATSDEASRIVFYPGIVYPYLLQQIGEEKLASLKGYNSEQEIPTQLKKSVLTALNRQCLPSNRLVEDPSITYDSADHMLHLGGCQMYSFWVVFLVKELLSDGVLVYASDNSHLRVRENLSSTDQNRISWMNVGLMNFLYGNLLEKAEHFNDESLGNGWYFSNN